VILGAGTVAEFAARTAMALGAEVKIFDNSIYKLKRLQRNVGSRLFTSILSNDALVDALVNADVAVGAIHSKSGRAPIVVTEEMVTQMKPGSVIMDVSIDQGDVLKLPKSLTTASQYLRSTTSYIMAYRILLRVSRFHIPAISNVLTPCCSKRMRWADLKAMYSHPTSAMA
jgi:alanine dehydrogenase